MNIKFHRNVGIPFDGSDYASGIGGLEMQVIELAKELTKRGHEVEVYVSCSHPGEYDGVKYKQPSEFKGDGDVSIYVDTVPDAALEKRSKWVTWALTASFRCYSTQVSYVVCDSPWTLDFYQSIKPSDRYVMIPCGFCYDSCAEPRLPKRPNSIMFAGHSDKGMDRLADILGRVRSRIPSATCSAYGGATLWKYPGNYRQALPASLKAAGVDYHGMVPREELLMAFKTSEVFILPRSTYIETFGLSTAEAMASGCVPICSRRGNLPNLLTEASGILLEHDGTADEAEAIVELLLDRERLERLSEGARAEVKKYDWSNIASLWEKGVLGL